MLDLLEPVGAKREVGRGLSIRDVINAVGDEELKRQSEAAALWSQFYDVCTLEHVLYYLRDYLAQYSLDGVQVREVYELEVSICLAEGMRRAEEREGTSSRIAAVREQLTSYNNVVRAQRGKPDIEALLSARLDLACAMLESE